MTTEQNPGPLPFEAWTAGCSIASDYARPGEVLVSQAVADASKETGIAFDDVGPIELKGVAGTVHLLRASLV